MVKRLGAICLRPWLRQRHAQTKRGAATTPLWFCDGPPAVALAPSPPVTPPGWPSPTDTVDRVPSSVYSDGGRCEVGTARLQSGPNKAAPSPQSDFPLANADSPTSI